MYEKPYRTLAKTMSWRVTGTIVTMSASYIITGELSAAMSIGVLEFISKSVLFYIHERLWDRIKFGRVYPADDYQI